jgi:hypothetical protein
MSKDNGGPAFPRLNAVFTGLDSDGGERYETEPSCGMTLRDYFATKASDCDVQDILNRHMEDVAFGSVHLRRSSITRQQARYMHADAMLLERNK